MKGHKHMPMSTVQAEPPWSALATARGVAINKGQADLVKSALATTLRVALDENKACAERHGQATHTGVALLGLATSRHVALGKCVASSRMNAPPATAIVALSKLSSSATHQCVALNSCMASSKVNALLATATIALPKLLSMSSQYQAVSAIAAWASRMAVG